MLIFVVSNLLRVETIGVSSMCINEILYEGIKLIMNKDPEKIFENK